MHITEEKLLPIWAVGGEGFSTSFSAARSYLIQVCTTCVCHNILFDLFGGSVEFYLLFVLESCMHCIRNGQTLIQLTISTQPIIAF
jgi:hypothetical protein